MRTIIFAALAATALTAAPVFATPGNNGGGNGGCGQGQSTNGCGGSTTPDAGAINNGGTGNGGQGGMGGAGGSGGSAMGIGGGGVGIAGAAAGASSNAAVHSANTNLNSASNRNDIANSNTVSTLGINSSSNDIAHSVRNTVGNSLGNVTAEGSSASTANANNSTVTVEGDEAQRRNPVSTAYAAPLVASADTCMGSSTAGAQGIGFGISIGSTWTDKNCVRLKNSRELVAMGYAPAAVQLLCTDKEVKAAMRAAGTPCK